MCWRRSSFHVFLPLCVVRKILFDCCHCFEMFGALVLAERFLSTNSKRIFHTFFGRSPTESSGSTSLSVSSTTAAKEKQQGGN